MASGADISTTATSMEREMVNNHLSVGEFHVPPTSADPSVESKRKQASNIVVEGFEGNVGVSEGESFFETSSIPKVAGNEICIKQTCQTEMAEYQAKVNISENEKEIKKDENSEDGKESATKCDEVMEEPNKTAEETYIKVGEEETSTEKAKHEHDDAIANRTASIEENPESVEQVTEGSKKDAKEESDADMRKVSETRLQDVVEKSPQDGPDKILVQSVEVKDEEQNGKNVVNPEKPFKHEEEVKNIYEDRTNTVEPGGETEDNGEHTELTAEDNIVDAVTVSSASEHSKDEASKHEEHAGEIIIRQDDEQDNERTGKLSDKVSEDEYKFASDESSERISIDEVQKEEKLDPVALEVNRMPEEKDLTPITLDGQTKNPELEVPKENVDDIETNNSQKATVEKQVKSSDFEHYEQTNKDNGSSRDEAEHFGKNPEACEITKSTIFEQSPTQEAAETEMSKVEGTDEQITEHKNANAGSQEATKECLLNDFQNDEKITIQSGEQRLEEPQQAKTPERIAEETNQNYDTPISTLKSSLEKEQENLQSEYHTPEGAITTDGKDEDDSCTKNEKESENNTVEIEEVKESCKEIQNGEEDIKHVLQSELEENLEQPLHVLSVETEEGTLNKRKENIEETTAGSKQAEEPQEEDNEERIIDESNIKSFTQNDEKNFQTDNENAENSTREILESQTAGRDESLALERDQNNESPIRDFLTSEVNEAGTSQGEPVVIIPTEASPEKKNEEDGSSLERVEEDTGNTTLLETDKNDDDEISSTVANITPETTEIQENPNSIPHGSLKEEQESLQLDGLTPEVEKYADGSPIIGDEHSKDNTVLAEDSIEILNSQDNEEILHKNELGENLEQATSMVSTETRAVTTINMVDIHEGSTGESSQGIACERDITKEEGMEGCITSESNLDSLSRGISEHLLVRNFQDEEISAEKSNRQGCGESETSAINEIIAHGNKGSESALLSSLVEEEETLQDESNTVTQEETSPVQKGEEKESNPGLSQADASSETEPTANQKVLEQELQESEPESLENSSDVMAVETERSTSSDKADDITSQKKDEANHNTEQLWHKEKNHEGANDTEDLEPVVEESEGKRNVEPEVQDAELKTDEKKAETSATASTLDSMEKLVETDKKNSIEEQTQKEDIKEVCGDTLTADLKEDIENDCTVILPQSAGEEMTSISEEEKTEEKPGTKTHDELEITNTDEIEIEFPEEENIMKDEAKAQMDESISRDESAETVPEHETHEETDTTNAHEENKDEVREEENIVKNEAERTDREITSEDDLTVNVQDKETHEEPEVTNAQQETEKEVLEKELIMKDQVNRPDQDITLGDNVTGKVSEKETHEELQVTNVHEETEKEVPEGENNMKEQAEEPTGENMTVDDVAVKVPEKEMHEELEKSEKEVLEEENILKHQLEGPTAQTKTDDLTVHVPEEQTHEELHITKSHEENVKEVSEEEYNANDQAEVRETISRDNVPVKVPEHETLEETEITNKYETEKENTEEENITKDRPIADIISGNEVTLKLPEQETGEEIGITNAQGETEKEVPQEQNISKDQVKGPSGESITGDNVTVKVPEQELKQTHEGLEQTSAHEVTEKEAPNENMVKDPAKGPSGESIFRDDLTIKVPAQEMHEEIEIINAHEQTGKEVLEESQSSESIESHGQDKAEEEEKMHLDESSKETQSISETIKSVILTAEEQGSDKTTDDQTAVHPEEDGNDIKDIHTVSIADERVDEVKESSLISTEYIKAPNEQSETVNSEVQEAKMLEEKTSAERVEDEGRENPTDISTVTGAEGSEEITEREVAEASSCYTEIKEATTEKMTSETGSESAQTDGNPVQVLNITKDDSIPHTDKADTSVQDSIVGNIAIEETANVASKIKTDGHDKITKETTQENASAPAEESKKDSDVACETKGQVVEEQNSSEKTNGTEEASQTISNPRSIEEVTAHEVADNQPLSEEIPKEWPSKEEECEPRVTLVEDTEEVLREESPEQLSTLKTIEGAFVEKEEPMHVEGSGLGLELENSMAASQNEENDVKKETFGEDEKEIEEVSETVAISAHQSLNASTEDEEPKAQVDGNLDEIEEKREFSSLSEDTEAIKEEIVSIQTPPSAMPSNEQNHETTTTTASREESEEARKLPADEPKKTEEASAQELETRKMEASQSKLPLDEEGIKESSEPGPMSDSQEAGVVAEAELASMKSLPEEKSHAQSAVLPSEEKKHETSTATESAGDNTTDVQMPGCELKTVEEVSWQNREPSELKNSTFGLQPDEAAHNKNSKEAHEIEFGAEKEEIREASEFNPLVFPALTEDLNVPGHTSVAEKSEEQNQVSSSPVSSTEKNAEYGGEMDEEENTKDSSALPTTAQDTQSQTEEGEVPEVSGLALEFGKDIQKESPDNGIEEETRTADEALKFQPQEYENKLTEEINQHSEPGPGTESPDLEPVAEGEIASSGTSPEEKKHVASVVLPSKEQMHETPTTESTEEKTEGVEVPDYEPKTTEEVSSQTSDPTELKDSSSGFQFNEVQSPKYEYEREYGTPAEKEENEEASKSELEVFQAPKDEQTIPSQTPLAEKSEEQSQISSSAALPSVDEKIEHEKEKEVTEDENAQNSSVPKTTGDTCPQKEEKEIQVSDLAPVVDSDKQKESHDEVHEEEARAADEASKSQPQEYENEMKDVESPAVNEKITDKSESFENLSVTTKEAVEDALEVSAHEVLPKPDEETNIKENHPETPMIEVKAQANQSQETAEIPHNDVTSKQVAVSEETTEKNHEEYKPKAEESPREVTKEIKTGEEDAVNESLPAEAGKALGADSQKSEPAGERTTEGKTGKEAEEASAAAVADSSKISLFDMMQRSKREMQKPAGLAEEENEATASKDETKTEAKTAKSDEDGDDEEEEEEGEENRKTDSGSDAPVMVEASRDIDLKLPHKKSHNILAGVGSKVKHSISKVKKAITGKSSSPKQQHSPK
ncbi:hypothetical protein Tsubulata_018885 [Turnera subulata]|uniref:Uncharacterized protein n=1 Tax=Turnera subulata TaxID=218843 RepID=A0A9Q0JA82_9ROSI|nr:hypothetical protein Tsubulata_018885 [Turnera subulata]